jgi:hypothetical protein
VLTMVSAMFSDAARAYTRNPSSVTVKKKKKRFIIISCPIR